MVEEARHIFTARTTGIMVASFLTPAATFTLYPFLTIYFTHSLAFGAAAAGAIISLRFLGSGLLGFAGGWVSDRIGLLPTYVAAALVSALAIVLMAFQTEAVPLAVLLIVLGVSGSAASACVRGLANLAVTAENRGAVQNYVHWLNNIGGALALPVSADLLQGGFSRTPFFVAAASFVVLAVLLAATLTKARRPSGDGKGAAPVSALRVLREDRAFAFLMGALLMWVMVEMQFESNIPLDLSYHFAHGAQLYGTLGVIDMALVFGLQLAVSRWLARQKSPYLAYAGFVALGGLIIGGLWQTVAGWALAIVLLALGEVFSIGQIMNLMGVLPREGRQGTYFAVFGMVQGLGTFLAYALGASAYQDLGPALLFALCLPAAIFSAILFRGALKSRATQAPDDPALATP